jgi:hypothetical protein
VGRDEERAGIVIDPSCARCGDDLGTTESVTVFIKGFRQTLHPGCAEVLGARFTPQERTTPVKQPGRRRRRLSSKEVAEREKAAEERVKALQEREQAQQARLNNEGTGRRAISDRDRDQLRRISQSDHKPSAMNQGG